MIDKNTKCIRTQDLDENMKIFDATKKAFSSANIYPSGRQIEKKDIDNFLKEQGHIKESAPKGKEKQLEKELKND